MQTRSRVINKTIRTRSMHEMNERVMWAKEQGYELVGSIVETLNGSYHALMRKEVVTEGKNVNSTAHRTNDSTL